MLRALPALAALAMLVAASALPAVPAAAAQDLDLTLTVPAGEYRAWRVALATAGTLAVGGNFRAGVATSQPVLPIIAAIEKDGQPWATDNWFGYDTAPKLAAEARSAVQDLTFAEHNVRGGGTATRAAPPGTYLVVLVAPPGQGSVDLVLRVTGDATVLASEAGPSLFDRGFDASETAADLLFAGVPFTHARTWLYTGADVPIEVEGRLFGYIGYHFPSPAHWFDPQGQDPNRSFVVGGAPGTWTARFPAEQWLGPYCLYFCMPGDSREDPPFVLAADVGL